LAAEAAALVWFRRDLRCYDHAALHAALAAHHRVYCAFIFDTGILDRLPARRDRRVEFILASVVELAGGLRTLGGGLIVRHGPARAEVPALAARLGVAAVYANHDYEPDAVARDCAVEHALAQQGIRFYTRKDQAIFDRDEVLTGAGTPFSVFTAYRKAWLAKLQPFHLKSYPVRKWRGRLASASEARLPSLADLDFETTDLGELGIAPGSSGARATFEDFLTRIDRYHELRDYPGLRGPSYLSVHLRFGTISVREVARAAARAPGPGPAAWLTELIWRDFYFMILHHHPRVVGHAFRTEYDQLPYENDPRLFAAWCDGRTGYPLVDAAMRQINRTGYMHNRLRMVAASFLVKDLLIDWRWGEKYFADRLNDFDLAANNGGWQWAASTGCDAQPYFRVFNPVTQSRRFDPDGAFIRRYVSELAGCDSRSIHAPWLMSDGQQKAARVIVGKDYPAPVVDHAAARLRAIALYKRGTGA
jgi:deoxyribodipyrimidine photo-lyase